MFAFNAILKIKLSKNNFLEVYFGKRNNASAIKWRHLMMACEINEN